MFNVTDNLGEALIKVDAMDLTNLNSERVKTLGYFTAKDASISNKNTVTSILVYANDPKKLIFFNDFEKKIKKKMDMKEDIVGVIVCCNFASTGDVVVFTKSKGFDVTPELENSNEAISTVRLSVCVVRYNQIKGTLRKTDQSALLPNKYLGTYANYKFPFSVDKLSLIALDERINGSFIDKTGEDILKAISNVKIKLLGLVCTNPHMGMLDDNHPNVTADFASPGQHDFDHSRFDTSDKEIYQMFEMEGSKGNAIILMWNRLSFRRARVPRHSSGIAQFIVSDSFAHAYFKAYVTDHSILKLKANKRSFNVLLKSKTDNSTKLVFSSPYQTNFAWMRERISNPSVQIVSDGVTDFYRNDFRLYTVIDKKHINVYEDFDAFMRVMSNPDNISRSMTRGAVLDKESLSEKFDSQYRKQNDAKHIYGNMDFRWCLSSLFDSNASPIAGSFEALPSVSLPEPVKVIELVQNNLDIEFIEVLSSYARRGEDILAVVASEKQTYSLLNNQHTLYHLTILRGNDTLFRKSFFEPVHKVQLDYVDAVHNSQPSSNEERRRCICVRITWGSGMVLHEVLLNSVSTPNFLRQRNVSVERARNEAGRSGRSGRVLSL